MEKLDTETLKTAALCALAVMAAMFWNDAREMRVAMRQREAAYQIFLAQKSGGKHLYSYINQDTLAAFPMNDGRAVICGIVPFVTETSTPSHRP